MQWTERKRRKHTRKRHKRGVREGRLELFQARKGVVWEKGGMVMLAAVKSKYKVSRLLYAGRMRRGDRKWDHRS